ncbi:MAG: hypothetical protein M1833_002399 [Piccolia ochrophora]|nr:MAG: hypothetical protein M1833_002399 [Piccolia ochrophora]
MAVESTLESVATIGPSFHEKLHPFTPLTGGEIRKAARSIRTLYPSAVDLQFKAITLQEPPKKEAVPFLEAEHQNQRLPESPRRAFINYYVKNTDKFHEAVVNLTNGRIEYNVRLGPNMHAPGDAAEIVAVEKAALEDDGVKDEIAKLQLPENTVVISDPWIYGTDGINDDERQYQCFLYTRDPMNAEEADSNHYAMPLDISPVVDAVTLKVTRIDKLPTGADNQLKATQPHKTRLPNEYMPKYQKPRSDLKPLQVIQPEGASFTVTQQGETGQMISWQKWSFRVGFNQREGVVLYDIRYDGRSLIYRLSLSDMNIPYADPRHPFHKKSAFDLGDAGAGGMANNLKLGCDCLGSIYYCDGVISDDRGEPVNMKNVMCIHEQDAGIGFKHTNYRTGNGVVVRNRELVVQSIITVSNYEYILAFVFNQAGEIAYEVRATGILSTQPVDEGVEVPWGTVVHPGVLATCHQHLFSLRIDPALDGHENRLVYDEALPMARSKDFNPHGVGYFVKETVIDEAGGFDVNYEQNRVFKIQNASVRNPVNGRPVAYKIQAPPFQKILADEHSFHRRRAEFADHSIYVTSHRDGEFYAGGRYTNQSRGGSGVRSWANRKDNVRDVDMVVWVQFGMNHIPRIEDFPIMPAEILRVSLKPVNFFDKNPALDVPPSEQAFNQSVLVSESHQQPSLEAKIEEQGQLCCASKL